MIHLLNLLSIRSKLFLLIGIPTLALLVLISINILTKVSAVNETDILKDGLSIAVKSSALVHEMQKERGATAGFLGSKGTKFVDILANQKKSTNQKRKELQATLDTIDMSRLPQKFVQKVQNALQVFGNIERIRERVQNLDIAKKEAIAYYNRNE